MDCFSPRRPSNLSNRETTIVVRNKKLSFFGRYFQGQYVGIRNDKTCNKEGKWLKFTATNRI